jgi:periplasmic divalent cation tolerance protein
MDYSVILTTTPNIDEAKEIAHTLVEKKLAACVNIIPNVSSIYCWQDKIVDDEEYILVIKTRKEHYKAVKKTILAMHSYELPEIILLPIKDGYKNYLNWIKKETVSK